MEMKPKNNKYWPKLSMYDKVVLCLDSSKRQVDIFKELGHTYSHISKIVNRLHKQGLAIITISGRDKFVTLNKTGKKVRCALLFIEKYKKW